MLSEVGASARARPVLLVAALLAMVGAPVGEAGAEHAGEAAERAAREILEARDRANDAAQAMFDAESQLDTLSIEQAETEQRIVDLEADVAALRADLADGAVRRFVGSDQSTLMLFNDISGSNDEAAARVYFGAATGSELVRTDDYEAAIDALEHARRDLESQRRRTDQARESFAALKQAAENEVLELQQLEQERLRDAEVQHELERQRRERLERERVEHERAEQTRRERAAAAAAAAGESVSAPEPDRPAPADQADPAPLSDDSPAPAPAPAPPANTGSGMACPVAGSRSFADTWGAPRSGGRRHQGVDMIAASGTPLVAVESGTARFKTNRLGGNAVWLTASSGTKYYYAHLSGWEGSSRSVTQGEVIGYVGNTGNTSVDHLHFEVHPGGGVAVNPYPYVRAAC